MINILKYEEFSINELFGLFGRYENDNIAKETFKRMLEVIEDLEVEVFADYKREVFFCDRGSEKSHDEVSQEKNYEEKNDISGNEKGVREKVELRGYKKPFKKQIKREVTSNSKNYYQSSNETQVAVMKGQSSHRFSSKILGYMKENSFSLQINGQTFVTSVKGKEGQPTVNPKISEMYWNFLSDIGNVQMKLKRRNIKQSDYDSEIQRIKKKYGKFK